MSNAVHIWVRTPQGVLERYTAQPFATEAEARKWARRYIPHAEIALLPEGGDKE